MRVPAGKAKEITVGECFLLEDPENAEIMFRLDAGALLASQGDESEESGALDAKAQESERDSQAESMVNASRVEEDRDGNNDDDDDNDSEESNNGGNERKRPKLV